MILNYTYRIYPDAKQETLLLEWLETCRVSYNYALREIKDYISSRKCPIDRCSLESEYIMPCHYPFPSYHQQQNNLPLAKREFPRLASVPSQVLQTNIRRLHDAWDFFRHRGYGFAVIAIESDLSIPDPMPHGHCIGVDVGLLSYCATSDGFVEPGRKFFKTAYRRLKVLQQRLSKKQKRSANYEKARKRVEKQHNHISFKRKDYQFKLAHKLGDMADTIFVEDIDFRLMAKGFLSKQTIDAAFGQFRSILKYVGKRRDVSVCEVNSRGSSQTCPNCRIEVKKELEDRWHSCPECKYEIDRDIASAQELCNRGIEMLSTQGLWGKEIGYQVGLSGVMSLDKWRGVARLNSDIEKPAL
ncbi:transposase [Pleurocapsales cyanobacterium LEGE 06147]|nr:transposase [Pleurocapsales cyanobacterium LEGE 06147]